MESSRPLSPTISRDVQNQPSPIREKLIYQTLPKNPNILDCLDITDQGLHFPYYRFGNIRTYLRDNQVSQHIRHKWIKNAIDAVAFIHSHAPWSPRTFTTDLFALGCLIYELSSGARPYDEIEDVGEVARLYAKQIFPNIDGFRYQDLIYKSWTSAYTTADMLREDYDRVQDADTDGTVFLHAS
ncbi:hypothetical protein N7530_004793 [Penicillium desertorum]|uniref:Protein kinase domain-containing protein n=1 Tax=Penicillium desertorum TaxID=1303715 RepID=A0A9X0BQQ4_9EURO|nr:hypothetical protein N7530_004793 [Penicillium desertorum]